MTDPRILGDVRVGLWNAKKKIEEQQTEIERLRNALARIANWEPHPDGKLEWYDAEKMQKIARQTLKERDK